MRKQQCLHCAVDVTTVNPCQWQGSSLLIWQLMCRYGMLISVLRKEKDDFDGLLAFYKEFINPTNGLMKWQVRSDNGKLWTS